MGHLYQGKVFISPSLNKQKDIDNELKLIIEAFKTYWRTGFHQDLGKDVPFHRPEYMVQSAIRHIHLRPIFYDAKWSKCFEHLAFYRRPPSDRWLTYCVTTSRNCLLISYMDKNAHTQANNITTLAELMKAAEWFFKEINEFPLDENQQVGLFSDKWLLPPSID
ncbi:MAG: type II toxin-antitoxin system YafO family toxin [Moraxellaceae bacterium]|nr:type II toxin-antitoxin system YafO family toxin [Moraxellaceae bacterium]